MPEQAPAPPLRSIAQSLSVAVTAITTMVTVASLAAMLGYTWKRDQQAQRRQADETVRSLTESLRLPLWFLDTETITVIGRAVAQDETVARLEIIGSGERPVFSEGRAVPVAFVRSAQVLYQGRPVGEVRLAVSDGRRQRLLWSVAVVAGLTGLLVTGVQLVLIGPLLRHRLRAAFASLDATIREYLAGRYDPPPPRVRYSEFQPLTEVLVQMGRTVERQLSELSVAEAKYRRIFEKARVGIFQTTLGGAVVDANPALAETLGYASREAVLAALRDVGTQVYADPEDRDRLLAQLQRDGRVARYQVRMRRLDGSPLWASVTADAVQDETGRQVLIEGLLDDVTEHEELRS
ncbi:MAG TPA: PAS domain-containing protein [Vicinamibacteria bacterium]|nr:PAS domain-containing protein [Vicinamibacteria bacterium]